MNKKQLVLLSAIITIVLALGAGTWLWKTVQKPEHNVATQNAETKKQEKPTKEETKQKQVVRQEVNQLSTVDDKVKKLVSSMSLEEKVGQIMMVGFYGTEPSSSVTDMIENKHIGNIILFSRNMQSPKQVATLNNDLQRLAQKQPYQLPFMIGVDQEGGDILRMQEKVSPIPSQQALGDVATTQQVYDVAKLNATELQAMGFNTNFAPVLDISDTDKRSFGSDAKKTYEYGKQVVKGLNDTNITGVVKHFPGNGRTNVDPHKDTSAVGANQQDLEGSDIYPFKQMINEVDPDDFFVLVTHVKYPAYDAKKPASLSPVIMQTLLRDKLGYKGIVVTDDLEMGAVNKYYTYKDMGREALAAGADLLLVCHEYDHQLDVYNGIVEGVKSGEIPESRLNEAVTRVLTHKMKKLPTFTFVDESKANDIVGSDEHKKVIENILGQ
ncbi:glycoside hydrolase family 3 N-terminal domain-containing protein [Priestia koreensis]|uniref:glycoside hydrolase family 3 N-terminal domain-containing protein n=1 Tax=Priestia koreensis TaxID=284581 RepID=UPI0034592C23